MKTKSLLVLGAALVFLSSPAQAHKHHHGILGHAKDAAEHAGHAVEHGTEDAAKTTADTAKDAGETVAKGTEEAVDTVEHSTKEVVAQIKKIPAELENFGNSCEHFLNHISKAMGDAKLPSIDSTMDKMAELELNNTQCRASALVGFTCGVFPYLGNIAQSIASGEKEMKQIVKDATHAYNHTACKKITDSVDRAGCSLVYSLGLQLVKLDICLGDVLHNAYDEWREGGKGEVDKVKLCTAAGEMGFSQVLDAVIADEIGDEEKALLDFFNSLKKFRTAMNLPEKAQSVVEEEVPACKRFIADR